MKTRILMYSSKELNKIVQKYVELDKISEHVYTFLVDKNKYDDPEQDLLDVVLCTSNVYWREATYQRKTLSQPGFVEGEEYLALHLAEHIDQIMRRGDFLKNLYVKIYEELGLNTAPLIEYRQKRTERIHTESVRLQQQEQAKETQVQQQEQERLESEKEKFEPVAKKLNSMGIPLVGLDVIDEKIIEINVTSPCYFIKEINSHFGIELEKKITKFILSQVKSGALVS